MEQVDPSGCLRLLLGASVIAGLATLVLLAML
jgi:hypothetical protein